MEKELEGDRRQVQALEQEHNQGQELERGDNRVQDLTWKTNERAISKHGVRITFERRNRRNTIRSGRIRGSLISRRWVCIRWLTPAGLVR